MNRQERVYHRIRVKQYIVHAAETLVQMGLVQRGAEIAVLTRSLPFDDFGLFLSGRRGGAYRSDGLYRRRGAVVVKLVQQLR